jgi:RDD family.
MENQYPQLIDRIQSTFIDTLVIIMLMFAFAGISDQIGNVPDGVKIAMLAALLLYEPICTAYWCTLGNYIKRIRVRQESDTRMRISLFQALRRFVVKLLLGWVSFITININPRKRAIHDLACGSIMIKL